MSRLYVIVTPIGNLEDISMRAVRILGELDVLVCEDTRHTRNILQRYEIRSPGVTMSCHEFNEASAAPRVLRLLDQGLTVGLCSDAGHPLISDPGYKVVASAIAAGHEVDVIPGPSAVSTALLISGLPGVSYTFKGFPPRKPGQRRKFLDIERETPHTLIFFESPRRVGSFLQEMYEALGNRRAAVCIELTKMFQQIHRGPLLTLARSFAGVTIRGEVTIVVAGNNAKFLSGDDDQTPSGVQGSPNPDSTAPDESSTDDESEEADVDDSGGSPESDTAGDASEGQ